MFLQSAGVCRLRLHSMSFPASSCLRESKNSTRRCRVYKASRLRFGYAARRSRSRRRQTTLFCWMQQQYDDCGCDLSERLLRRRRRCSIYARSSRFLQSALSMKITETLPNRPPSLHLLPPPILPDLAWLRRLRIQESPTSWRPVLIGIKLQCSSACKSHKVHPRVWESRSQAPYLRRKFKKVGKANNRHLTWAIWPASVARLLY